jgi:hypothetical protein
MANKWSAIDIGQAPGAIQAVNDHLIIYVSTTGDDDTGDGSLTAPYATPHKAMEHARKFYIGEEGKLTIKCAAGEYTFSKTLHLNHPQGEKIHLVGDDPLECGHPSTTYNYTVKGAYGVTFGYDTTKVGGSHKIKLLMGHPVSGENSGFTTEHGLTKGHVGSWLQVYPITLWHNGNVDPGGQVNLAPTLPKTYSKASTYDREWGSGNTSGGLSDNVFWQVDGLGSPGGSGGMQWRWVCGCSKITAVTGGAARLHHNPSGNDAGPQGNNSGSHIEINAQFMSAFQEPKISTERPAHKRSYYNDPQEYADNVNNLGGVVNSDTTKNIGLISTYSIPTTDGHTSGFVASTPDTIGARVLKTTFRWSGYDEWCAVLITDNKTFGSFKNIVFVNGTAGGSGYDSGSISSVCVGVDNNSILSPYSITNQDDDHIWNNDDHSVTSRCAWLNWSRPIDVWYGSRATLRQCTFNNMTGHISYYNSSLILDSCIMSNSISYMANAQFQSSINISKSLFNNAFYQSGNISYSEDEILPTGAAGWEQGDYMVQFTSEDNTAKFGQQGIITGFNAADRIIYFRPIVDVAEGETNPPNINTNFSESKRLFLVKPGSGWENLKTEVSNGWNTTTYATGTEVGTDDVSGPIYDTGPPASFMAGAIDGYALYYRSISSSDGRAAMAGAGSVSTLSNCIVSGFGGYGLVGSRNSTVYAEESSFSGIKKSALHSWLNCGLSSRRSGFFQSGGVASASNASNLYLYDNYITNMGNTVSIHSASHGWCGYNDYYIGRDGMMDYVHVIRSAASVSIDNERIYLPLFTTTNLWTRPSDGNKIPIYAYWSAAANNSAGVAPSAAFPCANPNIGLHPYVIDANGGRQDGGAILAADINGNYLPLGSGVEFNDDGEVNAFVLEHSMPEADNPVAGVGQFRFSVLGDGFLAGGSDPENPDSYTMDGWVNSQDNTSLNTNVNQYGIPLTYQRYGDQPNVCFFN